ncbi:MAG: hypothetical protein ABSC03_16555 [Verrucomicrobiota bacterium]|jgi:hypothetical protein
MSPENENLLLHDVVPRLRSAIRIAVAHVGSEDDAELLQDGTVMAAKILSNATRKGKRVTAGNVSFYTLQHLKSGRRTVGYSGVDVLASGTQLNGRSTVSSIHEEVPMSSETDETVPVSELMSRDEEDPCTKATRKLDWQQFYRTQDRSGRQLLNCMAEGQSPREIAGQLKLTQPAVRQRTDQLRTAVKSFFGEAVIAEVCRAPQWFNDLRAVKEHLACRGERNWQTH